MVEVADIVSYWRNSELNAIADYDEDGSYDTKVIEGAIDDAYAELDILSNSLPDVTIDIYAKRIVICILLSRLNVNPEAVALPMNDCLMVRDTIDKFIKQSLDLSSTKTPEIASNISVSKGDSSFSEELENFL